MKRLLLACLLFANAAFASDITSTAPTAPSFTLMLGAANVQTGLADAAACWAARDADILAKQPVAATKYFCNSSSNSTSTYQKPGDVQQTACPAGTFGTTFTQARSYTVVSGAWTAGAWLPATPPAASCVPIPVRPANESQTVACAAPLVGSWAQTRSYTLSGATWSPTSWSPTAAPTGACVVPLVFARIADEGESFTVTAGSVVRFGQDTRWIQKTISGAFGCTNAAFGSDPAPGTFKECDLANGTGTVVIVPTKPADIMTTVQCVAPQVGSWTQTVTTTLANNVWVANPAAPTSAPAGACTMPVSAVTDTAWVQIAAQGQDWVLFPENGQVRYGWGVNWDTKTVTSGVFGCNDWFLNEPRTGGPTHDPMPGFTKVCEKLVSAPHATQPATGMPVVNPAFVRAPATVAPGPRLGGSVSISTGVNFNQDTGAMREPSAFSHFLTADPIVFPGVAGAGHLHLFFGNMNVDQNTTAANIMAGNASVSAGGSLNQTAYWTPALIDTRNGKPLTPQNELTLFYYKCGYLGVTCSQIQPFPAGLRMIAGTSSLTTEVAQAGVIRIWCEGGDGTIRGRIPSCNRGEELAFEVIFPQCWDGVNLDSPNHKSHMAYATGQGCPADHPVPLTEISMNIKYVVEDSGTDTYLRLSSDNYTGGVGGYSMHADWFNGWDVPTMNTWVSKCINPMSDCHSALMGNGQWLY